MTKDNVNYRLKALRYAIAYSSLLVDIYNMLNNVEKGEKPFWDSVFVPFLREDIEGREALHTQFGIRVGEDNLTRLGEIACEIHGRLNLDQHKKYLEERLAEVYNREGLFRKQRTPKHN